MKCSESVTLYRDDARVHGMSNSMYKRIGVWFKIMGNLEGNNDVVKPRLIFCNQNYVKVKDPHELVVYMMIIFAQIIDFGAGVGRLS